MDDSAMALMLKKAVKITVIQNWKAYLAENAERIIETLNGARWDSLEPINLVVRVDPKDLSLHEVGFCAGCTDAAIYSNESTWYLTVPIFENSDINTIASVDKLVEASVEGWFPYAVRFWAADQSK